MERLHAKGLISDPVGKAKSVAFTDEGLRQGDPKPAAVRKYVQKWCAVRDKDGHSNNWEILIVR